MPSYVHLSVDKRFESVNMEELRKEVEAVYGRKAVIGYFIPRGVRAIQVEWGLNDDHFKYCNFEKLNFEVLSSGKLFTPSKDPSKDPMPLPLTNNKVTTPEPKPAASKYVVYDPKDVEEARKLVPLMVPFLDEFRWMTNPKGTAYQEAYQTLEFIAERGEIADPTPETLKQVKDSILVLAKAYVNRMDKPPANPAIAHLFPKPKKAAAPKKPEPTWGLTGIPKTPENTVQVVNPNLFDQLAERAVFKKAVDFLVEKTIDITNEFLSLSHNHPLTANSPEGEAYFRLKPIAYREDIHYPNMEVLSNVRKDIETLRKWHADKLGVSVDTYEPLSVKPKTVIFQHLEQEANDVTSLAMKTVLEALQHRREHPLPKSYEAAFEALVDIHLRGSLFGASASRLAKVREHIHLIQTWMKTTSKKEEPVKETTVKVGMQHFHEVTSASGDEGNGPVRIVGFARDYNFACQFAKGKGVFGGNATVMSVSREIVEMPDGSTYFLGKRVEFEDDKATEKMRLMASIRSKLTPEELKALNLLANPTGK